MIPSRIKKVLEISLHKTLRFNFKYFPFRQAIRFPVLVSRHCYIRRLEGEVICKGGGESSRIFLGFDGVGIFDNKRSRTIWEVAGKVVFEGCATIGHGSKISVGKGALLTFGDNVTITAESTILTTANISIGRNTLLSWEILMMDSDFHSITDANGNLLNPPKGIRIGNDVWIGCRVTILKGVQIADGCVIASGTLLTKSFDTPRSLIGKNPAQVIRTDVDWHN